MEMPSVAAFILATVTILEALLAGISVSFSGFFDLNRWVRARGAETERKEMKKRKRQIVHRCNTRWKIDTSS